MFSKPHPLPRSPVLGWANFAPARAQAERSIDELRFVAFTTSGRGAIVHALRQLGLPPASTVLVPSYHCPTMVAPVLLAGLRISYYGIGADGLPNLATIDAQTSARAILVPHLFGLAKSLATVRAWCDARGIALIEDCAHSYFGAAGDRPVGSWGDYSTASLSKFFPVPEAGLLASATRPIGALALSPPSGKAQLKGFVDIVERAVTHGRLAGLAPLLRPLFKLKNLRRRKTAATVDVAAPSPLGAERLMRDCDMDRTDEAPLWASMTIKAALPRGRIIARRRRNYALYARQLANLHGARPLFTTAAEGATPYVYPLWVDDADRVYEALRAQELPVFRWDRIWPGVPEMAGDVGPLWSRHVLQLLCHQDLDEQDIRRTSDAIVALLGAPSQRPDQLRLQSL